MKSPTIYHCRISPGRAISPASGAIVDERSGRGLGHSSSGPNVPLAPRNEGQTNHAVSVRASSESRLHHRIAVVQQGVERLDLQRSAREPGIQVRQGGSECTAPGSLPQKSSVGNTPRSPRSSAWRISRPDLTRGSCQLFVCACRHPARCGVHSIPVANCVAQLRWTTIALFRHRPVVTGGED